MAERFCILKGCGGKTCQHRHIDGSCVYEYDPEKYKPEWRWAGEGDPPKRWVAKDGTHVYRTYADYCD